MQISHMSLQGYNAAIIAYGQTGTGKTFTMEGAHSGPSRGIIPRAIEDVFMYIENDRNAAQSKFLVRASYLQIYNEVSMSALHASLATNKTLFKHVCTPIFRRKEPLQPR